MLAQKRLPWRSAGAIAPALLLVGLAVLPALARGAGSTAAEVASVKQLVAAANARQLPTVTRLFTGAAVLQVGKQQWRGQRAVTGWWRGQLSRHVRLTLRGTISTRGATAQAVLQRSTRGGDCARPCTERASWHFAGSRIDRMTLQPLAVPATPRPFRTVPVPSPPTGPPKPGVTPTIPT